MEKLNQNTQLREAIIQTLVSQDLEELEATQGLDTFYLINELNSERPYQERSTVELVSELNARYRFS
ncbi:MAG: hypothetical protein QNJ32_29520 [Xenococcaceae cyanobacterium MO_167.B27]|nr:hypothetical protein [Xenococcaceae cyanobacterium MO_167.B27]